MLLKEKCVQEIIKIWEKLDIVFVSIGSPASQVYTLATKNITREKGILNQLKIAGDICGRFFDEDGNYIKEIKNYNLIAISFEDLKKIPLRVGIAGGQDKIISIKVALFKKLINILVTDELTAEEILKK